MTNLTEMGKNAKAASRVLSTLTSEQKKAALHIIADEIEAQAAQDTIAVSEACDNKTMNRSNK